MSLRYRLWLSFAPLLLLLGGLGGCAIYSLVVVGDRIDEILQENYRSVEAMAGLNEALERIDSSFQSQIAGQPGAKAQFDTHWNAYRKHLDFESSNITEPGEAELVADLQKWTERYRTLGQRFFDPKRTPAEQSIDYYGANGQLGELQSTFLEIKNVAGEIRRLNQSSMERASANARQAAARVRWWVAFGLFATVVATGLLAWLTTKVILRPVNDLTRSAKAVGDGQFDQMVTAETRDEIGELVGAFNRMTSQLRDLRQSQAAELLRAQQASQAAIDSFPDPILVVDPAGRVDLANPAARRILGVVPQGDWQPPERLANPLTEAIRNQRPYITQSFDESVTYHIGGEDRIFVPQVLPVRDPYGNTLGAAVVLNDVTRFRLLDEFKTDLVATTSHELKTPLAGLRLAVHLLLEEAVGPLTSKQTELLIDARDNTERLVKIVDHLLSLARMEHGRESLTLHSADVAGLLREAAARVQPMIIGKSLIVDLSATDPLPNIHVDAQLLGHALDNLLINAATYTDAGGSITLTARRATGSRVELVVRDTGVGIPAEYLPHVFDKFFRIPDQTRGQGTGLGLAIVKEIVVAHGGEILCESEPGRGTTFRILLPIVGGSS